MPDTVLILSNPAMRCFTLLDQLPDDVQIAVGLDLAAFANLAEEANVLVLNTDEHELIRGALAMAPNLRWIHSLMAGVENKLIPEIRQSPLPLTNARGVYAESLGEFVIAACLFFAKELRRMIRQQAAHQWEPFDVDAIAGKTMAVVGYGEIGRACARRAQALGMRVVGVRRRPERSEGDPYVERVVGFADRKQIIAECDYLVLAAPNAPETKGLIGAAEFEAMKESCVLVNVGRGPVVDEPELVKALKAGRIRGAALDVFDAEPLPAGHPFYDLENVLLSPHSADHTPGWLEDSVRFFLENFRRFQAGEPLKNLVNKELGY